MPHNFRCALMLLGLLALIGVARAATGVVAWGANEFGQLGDDTATQQNVPVDITSSGALNGKTVTHLAAGGHHTLALCSDGTVAAWGRNDSGQLGDGSMMQQNVPVSITGSGALNGKSVVHLATGTFFSLALCSDGTVAAWGRNEFGQVGDGTIANRLVPVDITNKGVLNGKTVVQLVAGGHHSVARCSDGTIAAWGENTSGQLGDGTTANHSAPVNVTSSGALNGKTVAQLAAGAHNTLALCSDGTVTAWGRNTSGQSGDGSGVNLSLPVDITNRGALNGKTVMQLVAGGFHSFARCSDGTTVAWGQDTWGQLGDGGTTNRLAPVDITGKGVLNGKAVAQLVAGGFHTLARCGDGTVAAWGQDTLGQVGDGSGLTKRTVPVDITPSGALNGRPVTQLIPGKYHSLALTVLAWPTVAAVTRAGADPTNSANASFTVTFSESVTGVDVTDFAVLTTGTLSGAMVTGGSGSGATYTVTVGGYGGSGTLRLDVRDDDSIVDGAHNPLGGPGAGKGAFTTGQAYTIIGLDSATAFVVTKTADTNDFACDADCSLREAIERANLTMGASSITFAPGVSGVITLNGGQLDIGSYLTITGPASAPGITLDAYDVSRVFAITSGTVNLFNLTIANGSSTSGGGIYSSSTVSLINCTLSGNHADTGLGGAIFNSTSGRLSLTNCTFSGNHADDGDGGAIRNDGALNLINCTFSGNHATNGSSRGGAIFNDGTLNLKNSLIAGNSAEVGPDIAGAVNSQGHNLIGDTSGSSGLAGSDLQNVAPGLDPAGLSNYGGPTPTMAILPASPAISAADPTGCPATDQRGVPRPQPTGGLPDIGAFEFISLNLSISDATVTEGNNGTKNAAFTISLSTISSQTVTVHYATANGTAMQPSDYTAAAGTLSFAPGQTAKIVTILVKGDTLYEPHETFKVTLSSPTNATIADGLGVGTLTNDDTPPQVAVSDPAPLPEGDKGTKALTFTISLNPASGRPVTVDFAFDGTATPGLDTLYAGGFTRTFAPGETSKTVTVSVRGDTLSEANETVRLTVTSASLATVAKKLGVGLIVDDDPLPGLSINDVQKAEGSSGVLSEAERTNFTFTVTLSTISGQNVTVAYATADGTALKPSDYTGKAGTLSFAPGETTKTILVAVKGDTSVEPDETFFVNLSNSTNAAISDGQGMGTIQNDD